MHTGKYHDSRVKIEKESNEKTRVKCVETELGSKSTEVGAIAKERGKCRAEIHKLGAKELMCRSTEGWSANHAHFHTGDTFASKAWLSNR